MALKDSILVCDDEEKVAKGMVVMMCMLCPVGENGKGQAGSQKKIFLIQV